jgi:uncharacterized protein YutE (UPF0331/DUF86 family)
VKTKLGKLETYIQGLEDKRGASLETFRLDRDLEDIVERRFVKAIQASIDVASHFVASIPSREPGTYRDLFTVFAEEEILDADLAERRGEMAGFRSVLAHDSPTSTTTGSTSTWSTWTASASSRPRSTPTWTTRSGPSRARRSSRPA